MVRLEIRLFGEVEVYLEGQLVRFPTQKTKELFAYLVLHHQNAQPRPALVGLLWPESDEEKAKANLRQTLSRLRHALERAECLKFSGGAVQFRSNDFWCDVLEFERLVREGTDLERVLELYRGPLLCDLYEDWVLIEQERLQTLYLEGLEQLARVYTERRDYDRAIKTWQRVLREISWHEQAHRQLMELYALQGDRTAALHQYTEYVAVLRQELGAAPLPEMRTLCENLQKGFGLPKSTAEALPTEMPFVGRQHELGILHQAWQDVLQGHARAVFIEGEIGVGKTTFVEHFLRAISASPLRGVAHPSGSGLPYQLLLQAVRSGLERTTTEALARLPAPWRSELARALPELHARFSDLPPNPELAPAQGKARWFEALTGFCEMLARERPRVLFFDDLHWADDATLEYLGHLVGAKHALPLLLIGTYRSEEALSGSRLRAWLDTLGPVRSYHSLALRRLSRAETEMLLEQLLGVGVRRAVPLLYDKTEGNSLFLKELTHSLIRSGALSQDDAGQWKLAAAEISATHLPESLRELVHASLRRAPERAQKLLGLMAVKGRSCELPVLKEIVHQREEKLLDDLDALRRVGLIVEREGRYQFYHELMRQVLYDELSADRKRLWHKQIGQALEELYPHELEVLAGELAAHFEQAQQWEKAIVYAMRAGEQAQRLYAYGDAQRYLAKALKLFEKFRSPLSSQQQQLKLEVLSSYADESVFPTISDVTAALEELQAAVSQMIALAEQLGDRVKLCKAYQQRARLELAAGSRDAAHKALQGALSLSYDVATPELALVLERTGRLYRQMGEYSRALESHRRAEQVGRALGDLGVQGKALADIAVIEMFVGKFADARAHMEEALELLQRAGRRRVQASALNNLGIILQEQGDYHRARAFYEQAYQLMSAEGDARGIGIVLLNLGRLANDQGDYGMALEYLERVVAKLAQPGLAGLETETFSEKGRAHVGLGELELAMGCSSRAVCLLEADRGIATEAQRFYFTHCQILRASGRSDEAKGYLQKAHDEVCRIAKDIQEEALKKSFLENVPLNRQIIQEWQAVQRQDAHGKTVKS